MPYQHTGLRLKKNHGTYGPQIVIALSTARTPVRITKDGTLIRSTLRGIATCDSRLRSDAKPARNTAIFTERADFWTHVYNRTSPCRNVWVIGHGVLADITLAGFTHEVQGGRLELDSPRSPRNTMLDSDTSRRKHSLCVLESPPTIIGLRCVDTGGRIVVVDLQNWFHQTVAAVATTVGQKVPDLPGWDELDIDWALRTRMYAGVIHDVFVELVRYVKAADLGIFRYTAAGQAMSAFRHRYMKHEVFLHDNVDVKKLERASYYGGRTEVFKRGRIDHTVHQLDVNGLYPYIMATCSVPTKLVEYGEGGIAGSTYVRDCPQRMVAAVEIDTSKPGLPLRTARGILYPTGQYRTILCGKELADASLSSCVQRVGRWAVYDCCNLLQAFAEGCWQTRMGFRGTGQQVYEGFTKLLLNSLHGKFAQLSPGWEDVPDTESGVAWSSWVEWVPEREQYVDHRSIGLNVQRRAEPSEPAGSFPAIAAFITSAGRCYMNTLRSYAGRENVYYQGCDSLIVSTEGRRRLDEAGMIQADVMGKLKTEMIADNCCIFGCQDYRIGDKVVVAGRRPDGSYIDVARMRQLRDYTMQEMFRSQPLDTLLTESHCWERKGNYVKGVVGADGWVTPISVTGEVSSGSVSTD